MRGSAVRRIAHLIVVASALVLAGCGDPGRDSSSSRDQDDPTASSTVDPRSFRFRSTATWQGEGGVHVRTIEGLIAPTIGSGAATSTVSIDGEPMPELTEELRALDGVLYTSFSADLRDDLGVDVGWDPQTLSDLECPRPLWYRTDDGPAALDELLAELGLPPSVDVELAELADGTADPSDLTPQSGAPTDGEAVQVVRDDSAGTTTVTWRTAPSGDVVTDHVLELSDVGSPVDVVAPPEGETCTPEQAAIDMACTFGAADANEAIVAALAEGDLARAGDVLDELCPSGAEVWRYVGTLRCQPDLVAALLDDLGLDPNDEGRGGSRPLPTVASESADPACTPEQDVSTVRTLLERGADPCAVTEPMVVPAEAQELVRAGRSAAGC